MSDPRNDSFYSLDARSTASGSVPAAQRPETGPRLLFFSGGTALRGLSRELVHFTHNSIHIITPFDSGGSSAGLRKAFHMPAVGDLRNRLLALADPAPGNHRAMCRLAAYRFPQNADTTALYRALGALCSGEDTRVVRLDAPLREVTCRSLSMFREAMPPAFDLRGASIGNLLLTGSWLRHDRQLDPALREFTGLIEARGIVRPVLDGDYQLAAELEDGSTLTGQHHITGKEVDTIASPVKRVWLTADETSLDPVFPRVDTTTATLIAGADLICYPPGSFYTSVLANLLPGGVADAISEARCPKVYLPAMGHDPEALGLDVFSCATRLVRVLEQGLRHATHPSRLLTHVMTDIRRGDYPGLEQLGSLERLGIQLVDVSLVSEASRPLIDGKRAIRHLLSMF